MSTTHARPSSTDNREAVEAAARAALPAEVVQRIAAAHLTPNPESHLIGVLHLLQDRVGHLARPQLDAVAQLLRVPTAKVTGVATFYALFRLKPRGKHTINVCLGTACYVNGAQAVMDRLQDELAIEVGETTKDGLFTLEASRCLGTCGLAPVLLVGERAHPKVRPEKIGALVDGYRSEGGKG